MRFNGHRSPLQTKVIKIDPSSSSLFSVRFNPLTIAYIPSAAKTKTEQHTNHTENAKEFNLHHTENAKEFNLHHTEIAKEFNLHLHLHNINESINALTPETSLICQEDKPDSNNVSITYPSMKSAGIIIFLD